MLGEGKMMVDKKAVGQTVALLLLSWAAFPFIYYLLVKRNKKEEKENVPSKKKDVEGSGRDIETVG